MKSKVYQNIRFIFSFEFFFILFVFSSRLKADERLSWIPIDLTLATFLLSVFVGILVLIKRDFRIYISNRKQFYSIFAFSIYMIFSMVWSLSDLYAREKTISFILLTGWFYIAASFIISLEEARVKRFINLFITFGFVFVFEVLLKLNDPSGFIGVFGGNYLGTGRIIGVVLLFSIVHLSFNNYLSYAKKIFLLCVVFILAALMFKIGARGPLISVFIAILSISFAFFRVGNNGFYINKNILFFLFFLTSIVIYFFIQMDSDDQSQTISRLMVLTDDGMGDSAGIRKDYYFFGLNQWFSKPFFGYGIGSWPILLGIEDTRSYPHNIIIEVLVELGFFGALAFLLFFWFSLVNKNLFKYIKVKDKNIIFLYLSAIFYILNAMFSGDFNDNRYVFLFLGLLVPRKS